MSDEKFAKIETKIENMEENLTRIDNEAEQISDIKSTVESVSVKLDERTAAVKVVDLPPLFCLVTVCGAGKLAKPLRTVFILV